MTSIAASSRTAAVTAATNEPLILRLQLPPEPAEPVHVQWDAGVVDNEHMNRKKSKRCCIFHKQRPFDESSSEEEDDDEGGWELGSDGKPMWVPNSSRGESGHACGCGHAHNSGNVGHDAGQKTRS